MAIRRRPATPRPGHRVVTVNPVRDRQAEVADRPSSAARSHPGHDDRGLAPPRARPGRQPFHCLRREPIQVAQVVAGVITNRPNRIPVAGGRRQAARIDVLPNRLTVISERLVGGWRMAGMPAPVMLLDGASMVSVFFGVPSSITAPDGRPVNAVRGFLDSVATLITRERPPALGGVSGPRLAPQFRVDLIPVVQSPPGGVRRDPGCW